MSNVVSKYINTNPLAGPFLKGPSVTNLFLENRGILKEWSSEEEYNTFLSPNDFEIALEDYSLLKDTDRLLHRKENLNWFEFEKYTLYTSSLDSYARYLLYVILTQVYKNKNFNISYYETYFTEQLTGYLAATGKIEALKDLKKLQEMWNFTFTFIEYIVNRLQDYYKIMNEVPFYFMCNDLPVKGTLPFIGFREKSEDVDGFLLIPFYGVKPCWYTIPSLFKMYSYFLDLGISLKNVYIFWFNMENHFSKIEFETIPLTPNVLEMIGMYSKLQPLPFPNIFNKSSKYYYNKTPLKEILKK